MKIQKAWGLWLAAAGLLGAGTAQAQYEAGGSSAAASAVEEGGDASTVNLGERPLVDGSYGALLGQFKMTESDPALDKKFGGAGLLGYRAGTYGIEAGFGYVKDHGVDLQQFMFNGLLYPFKSVPMLYGLAGVGALRYAKYPIERSANPIAGGDDFVTVAVQGGVGYLFPLSWGNYEYALRAEALYRVDDRFLERESDFEEDIRAPGTFKHVLLNFGLQLPFRKLAPPPPPPPPVEVVAPLSVCSDSQDNDGDGLIDFPGDNGCSSAEDNDESDPPVCSDGKDNDGDGLIDFPADKGCTAADDNDEVNPCKTPAPGEAISLKGCGIGDVIVLRGVNFEFDKARLTANAKTILDNVASELAAYPDIEVELSGHTDAKGSDEYNQALSDKRAAAVKRYLVGKDTAESRMTTVGAGESQPVADNETDEGRELNRRVELKVTQGVAPGGPEVVTESASPVEAPAADAVPADPAATDGASAEPLAAEAAPAL